MDHCNSKHCKKCDRRTGWFESTITDLDLAAAKLDGNRPKRETTREEAFKDFESGAKKEVTGKLRVDLIPPEMMIGDAEVLTYGASKYADRNWEKGIPYMTSAAAAMRHLLQWLSGIDKDEESGLLHIEQARLNLGMISTQTRRGRTDLDDRPSKNK